MRKVSLFIAMSLDGYIADKKGGVDWFNGQDSGTETEDGYSTFIQDVDTVLMGWNTYHQIVTQLSPDQWVYPDQTSYVFTHRQLPPTDNIHFSSQAPWKILQQLKKQAGKKIWICGGRNLIRQLMEKDLIDEYNISVIPTILGSGIPLFHQHPEELKLKLVHVKTYNGIVELLYERRST